MNQMDQVVTMAGIFNDITKMSEELETLLTTVIAVVMAMISTILTWGKTGSVLKAFVSGIGAAAVVAVIASMDLLGDSIEKEINENINGTKSMRPAAILIIEDGVR